MKNKATHSGHCQACGSLQKLPNGKLSLHGYTVDFGFFNGTCQGAKSLPYEQSCDLIQCFIGQAQSQLEALRATQAQLRQPATEEKAWINVYRTGRKWGASCSYRWEYLEVTMTRDKTYEDGFVSREYGYTVTEPARYGVEEKTEVRKVQVYEHAIEKEGTLAVCSYLNSKRADAYEREARNLEGYIKWQQSRVDSWKPAELLPVDHKDKEGFKPEEAR